MTSKPVSFTLPLSEGVMDCVRDLVLKRSGISLAVGKENLLESRLRRRLRATNIELPEDYLDYLNKTPEEFEHFVNVFTTNETCFFRTDRVWRYIENKLLATWSKESSVVRHAWSAASSTGEEAYSLAMATDKFNQNRVNKLKLRIVGSDVSTEVIAKAKSAVYRGRTISRLKSSRPDALLNYFSDSDGSYTLIPSIRSSVTFSQHNLYNNPPFNNYYDLVLLRNVLIYFTEEGQDNVLSKIYASLRPGGVLILGESESLTNRTTPFRYCEPLVYQKPMDG